VSTGEALEPCGERSGGVGDGAKEIGIIGADISDFYDGYVKVCCSQLCAVCIQGVQTISIAYTIVLVSEKNQVPSAHCSYILNSEEDAIGLAGNNVRVQFPFLLVLQICAVYARPITCSDII
jgi:hypothetical protein